jgi:hypothetical protein
VAAVVERIGAGRDGVAMIYAAIVWLHNHTVLGGPLDARRAVGMALL